MSHTHATSDLDENDLDIIRELERGDDKNFEELADELGLDADDVLAV